MQQEASGFRFVGNNGPWETHSQLNVFCIFHTQLAQLPNNRHLPEMRKIKIYPDTQWDWANWRKRNASRKGSLAPQVRRITTPKPAQTSPSYCLRLRRATSRWHDSPFFLPMEGSQALASPWCLTFPPPLREQGEAPQLLQHFCLCLWFLKKLSNVYDKSPPNNGLW